MARDLNATYRTYMSVSPGTEIAFQDQVYPLLRTQTGCVPGRASMLRAWHCLPFFVCFKMCASKCEAVWLARAFLMCMQS